MANPVLLRDVPIIERQSLCLSSPEPGIATHSGEDGFVQNLVRHIPAPESNALENLVELKRELKGAKTEIFWKRLMEGMTEMCHAQYGFVAKRMLVDDHDSAVEMPSIGEEGSCLLGVAFYFNDGNGKEAMHRDYKYLAWGAPCGYMKHDKVFLVPDQMSTFIQHNPNALPFAAEAYLGIPLFSEGKCFAHFGMMWTQEGLKSRNVSWGFTEMLMHSLEDFIIDRLVSGQGFAKPAIPPTDAYKLIPREAITATQSLKPYAKSLSHELRTPMQGVVGMLDVMHATVQEQIEGLSNTKLRHVFQALKNNIEVVQDSSKRAVEAADNVVHAYDMNMQIPDTPLAETSSPAHGVPTSYFDFKPTKVIEGSNIPANPHKRRRSNENTWQFGNATKIRHTQSSTRREVSPRSEMPVHSSSPRVPYPQFSPSLRTPDIAGYGGREAILNGESVGRFGPEFDSFSTPGLKQTHIRELIPIVINDSLRVGGRPDSAISEPIDLGEIIEVRSRSSNGITSQKTITWIVEEEIPDVLIMDEKDFAKLISAVFLNAIKFTEDGKIRLTIKLSSSGRSILINVIDTGDGIPKDFQPELFKAFSREDVSLTRTKEGLGLGLLVAKGLARRMGGDIRLVRSDTSGESKGSEFEIRLPIDPGMSSSRSGTPSAQTPEPVRSIARNAVSSTPNSSGSLQDISTTTANDSPTLQPVSPITENAMAPALFNILHHENRNTPTSRRSSFTPRSHRTETHDRKLSEKYPLTFLVAEDNKLNRKLLVSMLSKLGYKDVYEAFDGKEAVRIMREVYGRGKLNPDRIHKPLPSSKKVDIILMDLWMPEMDGYQATEEILRMFEVGDVNSSGDICGKPKILAVSADVTGEAISRATRIGMEGFMTKPYKLMDLQRLIVEFCV